MPFLIELPLLVCSSGICEEKYHSNLMNLMYIHGHSYEKIHPHLGEGLETEISRMMCECSPTDAEYLKFREIMMDIYVTSLHYMYLYGDENRKVFTKSYNSKLDNVVEMYN